MILPTEEEIDKTFELIQDRLEEPEMDLICNRQVKVGYEFALEILEGNKEIADIASIKAGIQARAIAMITFDYLNGTCSQQVLCNVPLKNALQKS